ncbi:MAG: SHOCT domain-containing protein [Verrucomicrobiia bacterium]
MKKISKTALMALAAMLLLTGCLDLHLGGGSKSEAQYQNPTLGQQLIDLQQARNAGAISAEQYEAQKAKLLGNK